LRRWPRLPSVHQQLCGLKQASNERQRSLSAPWDVARPSVLREGSSHWIAPVEVSSKNTSRAGSSNPCARIQRRRARGTSARSRCAACRLFLTVMSWRAKKRESAPKVGLDWDAFAARKPPHSASNPVAPRSEREFAAVLLKFAPRYGPRVARAPAEAMR
jgi:hypothetical protein